MAEPPTGNTPNKIIHIEKKLNLYNPKDEFHFAFNEESIHEVIAFPKNSKARDLLMGAPSTVNQQQLDDVHIMLKPIKKED